MNAARAPLLAILVAAFLCCDGAAAQSVVATRAGEVRGVTSAGITSFKGIPYAAPPVGALRWRPPQPPAPWRGVRAGNRTAPLCMQLPNGAVSRAAMSEDCLYLNIWRPADTTPGSRLAVMVWLHGGGFIGDAPLSPETDGTNLARNGVIVVTFNYRLGRFGWFAYPELTAEAGEAETGNFGLMDDIATLRWVQDNIAGFGGDPGRVTIFGQSAGGISVNALMSTPSARGLFSAAITQSGFGRNRAIPLAAAEKMGTAFAALAGAKDLAGLRQLPADSLVDVASDIPAAAPPGLILDGKLMRTNIDETFAKGAEAKVPWIVGSNDYEASLFPERLANPGATLDALSDKVRKRALALYDPHKSNIMPAVVAGMLTDKLFTEPARFLAAAHAKSRQPVYRYFFAYVPERARGRVPGAAHTDELKYVFGNFTSNQNPKIDYTFADRGIAAVVERYWTDFAKTRNPNGPGVIAWPQDKDDRALVFEPGGGQRAVASFRKPQLDFVHREVPRLD